MKYVLARNTHSAGTHYHEVTTGSGWFPTGTPRLSNAVIYETADAALKELQSSERSERLMLHDYYVMVITEKEIFKAKLENT